MSAIQKIGILGLGKMGAPMARHLIAKGYNVAGFDPVDAARRAARSLGVSLLDSPREVAHASDLVMIVVGFDHEVDSVVFGANGIIEAARSGLIVAVGSTVAPRYAKRLAERVAERGVILLDAPLARGERAAVEAKLPFADLRRRRRSELRGLPAGVQRLRLGNLPSRPRRRRAGGQDGE